MIVETLINEKYQVSSIKYSVYKKEKIHNTKYSIRNTTIIDLGAGTGTVIFALADTLYKKNKQTKLVAVEIHPLLYFLMQVRRLLHPYKQHIEVVRADMFSQDFWKKIVHQNKELIIYLYIGTTYMNKLKKHLSKLAPKTRIISYMYAFLGWENMLVLKKVASQHAIYEYRLDK